MRLSRNLKKLLFAVSILVVLLLGFSAYINFFYLKDLRLRAEEQLVKVFEAPVRISSLSFDIFRGVTARKVEVFSKKGPILSIDSFKAGFEFKDLRQRKFSLKDIEFKDVYILVSNMTNDNKTYFQHMKNKFSGKQGTNTSLIPVKVAVENIRFDNVTFEYGTRIYPLNRLVLVMKDGKTSISGGINNCFDLMRIDFTAIVSNHSKRIDANVYLLKPEVRRIVESCRLTTSFTDLSVLPVELHTAGPGLSWNGFALVRLASQSIEFPALANTAEFRGVRAVVSGFLRDFSMFNYQFDIAVDGLSAALLKSEISGVLKVNARVSGSFRQKIFRMEQVDASSDRLEVSHFFSNTLGLRSFSLKVHNNRITDFSGKIQNDAELYELSASTGDLFAEKIGLDIRLKSDQISLDKIRWDGSIIPSSSSTNKRSVTVGLSGVFGKIFYNNLRLENAAIKARMDQGVVTAEQFNFSGLGGEWNGNFKLAEKILQFSMIFKNISIPPARTHLTGELNGTYDVRKKLPLISGSVHDAAAGFSKFDCSDLRSSVHLSNTVVSMPDLTAIAYKGKISASITYDIGTRKGEIRADANSVDVSELYQALLGPTASRFSGTGKLNCSVDIGPRGPDLIKGNFRFEKGVIQDTVYQQDFANRIKNETIKDIIIYDYIASGFSMIDKTLRIDGLEFISTDLEVRMSLDYNTLTRKRSSIEPYKILMSEAFIQNFNVLQLPVSFITSKNGQWAQLRINEKESHIEIIKPLK